MTETPETTNDAPETAQPPADATGETNGGNAEQPIIFASQADLQKYINESIKDRLAREEKKRDEAAAKARKEAEEAALEQNQQFKELADKRAEEILTLEAKLANLDQVQAERDELSGVLSEFLEKERDGIPQHVLALLDELSPVKQLRYIAANRASFSPKTNGVPATPKADHDPSLSIEQKRERGGYYRTRF